MRQLFTFRLFTLVLVLGIGADKAKAQIGDDFIFKIETTRDAQTIFIRTYDEYNYNFRINWGDGTIEEGITESINHRYANKGEYTIKIDGLRFAGMEKNTSIISIEQWGDAKWETMEELFDGMSDIKINATDAPNLILGPSLKRTFAAAKNFNDDIGHWDVSKVTDMTEMFEGANSFNADISGWDVSNVTNMSVMFGAARAFNADISGWNVSKVTNMSGMFSNADAFNRDIGGWDTGNVTDMSDMFNQTLVFNQDLSDWDVSKVKDMSEMFAKSTFNGDLTNWKLSSIEVMHRMFDANTAFNGDVSNWDLVSSATINCQQMFRGATAFNGDVSKWNVSKVARFFGTFERATAFNGDVSNWDITGAETMGSMFLDATAFDGNISGWDFSNTPTLTSLLKGATAFTGKGDFSNTSFAPGATISGMFEDATSFNGDISGWDVSNVSNFSSLFKNATSFNQNLSAWDVSSATNMGSMFRNASSFNSNLSDWDVSNVTGFAGMFLNAIAFNSDLSAWRVTSATSISGMFNGAILFNSDIGGWDVSNVRHDFFVNIFKGATAFDQYLGGWDISKVSNLTDILSNSGLSYENYNATLINWLSQDVRENVSIGVTGLEYCNYGQAARQRLIDTKNWTFDGDVEINNCFPVLVSGKKDSDTQLTVIFDAAVQTNAGNPTDFTVNDGLGANFVVQAQADASAGDSAIVLTTANLATAIGDLAVSYTNNNNEIRDRSTDQLPALTRDIDIDTDTQAPMLSTVRRDSDTQLTLFLDEPVQTFGTNPGDFTLVDGDGTNFAVTAQADGTSKDNQIVLTVENLSGARGVLTLSYVNGHEEIRDFGRNSLADFAILVCPQGFTCNQIEQTLCTDEKYTRNDGTVISNPQELVQFDTVGTVITEYKFTIDESINCCPTGFTCAEVDVNSCAYPYISPLGNTLFEPGKVVDLDETNMIKNVYTVTFDRAEPTVDVFQNAIIAESGSVTYQANTNATGGLSFDTSQDYYVDLNALQDDLNGTNRSVFMWVKSKGNVTDFEVLFSTNREGTGAPITTLYIHPTNDQLRVNAQNAIFQNSNFNLSGDVWNYVGYTYDATTFLTSIYVNGILTTTFTRDQSTTAVSRYSLGQEFNGTTERFHYNGDMAEVSVWNEVLTGADIRQAMQEKITDAHPAHDHLVGYYSVFGVCNDDPTVLKDHSGKDNNGVMKNGFTQDFKNVQAIEDFNAVGWYDSFSWKKDGTEVGTEKTFSTQVAAGSYEFTASRNYMQSSDTWSMTLNGNATTVDNLADETLCADDPITRTVTANTVNYIDFEEGDERFISINGLADRLVDKSRSVFMWFNLETGVSSNNFNELLVFQGNDVSKMGRFYIRDTERLALWDANNSRVNSTTDLDRGVWYFIGYTYDNDAKVGKVYVNGVEEGSGTIDMPLGQGWLSTLGAKHTTTSLEDYLDGQMAELTIWDKVLTAEEITALMGTAPANDATNLVASYGTLPGIADDQLRDLTANGIDGLTSHIGMTVDTAEVVLDGYNASANYLYSWKKGGIEFDTDATGNITVEEGTIGYTVRYGTPLFQKTDDFNLSYTNLIPTQPAAQTVGVTGSATFGVDEIEGATYQWYKKQNSVSSYSASTFNMAIRLGDAFSVGNTHYLGGLSGLFISKNGGETWERTTSGQNGFAGSSMVNDIYVSGGSIYVATDKGLSISTDGGSNWTTVTGGQSGFANSDQANSVFAEGSVVYAGTEGGGLSISQNSGASWSEVTSSKSGFSDNVVNSVYAVESSVYVGTDGGLSISLDAGSTWKTITSATNGFSSNSQVNSVYAIGDKVYVGTEAGELSISINQGTDWSTLSPEQIGNTNSSAINAVHGVGDEVYVVTDGSGAVFSSNGGNDWGKYSSTGNDLFDVFVTEETIFTVGNGIARKNTRDFALSDIADETVTNQIQGATTHRLTINNLTLDQSDTEYFVIVTKDNCQQQSDDVTLTVLDVPVVSAFTPDNGAIDVALGTELSMEFSRTITAGSGELKLFNYATDALVQTFAVGDLTIDGITVSATLSTSLDYATQYYLTLDAGLVVDAANAGNLAISDKDTWSFHTVCEDLILTEPEDQTGFIAGSASFSVPEVAGASYQWFNNDDRLEQLIDVSSSITAVYASEAGIYTATADQWFISTDDGETFTTKDDITGTQAIFELGSVLYLATSSGLYISKDNGGSFDLKTVDNSGLASLEVNNVYVNNGVIYAATVAGLSISTDNGVSFTTKTVNDGLGSNEVFDVFEAGGKLYVGTEGGLSISTDGGASFTNKDRNNGLKIDSVENVVVSADGTIYVGSVSLGLYVSKDGGESFNEIAAVASLIPTFVRDLEISNDIVYIVARSFNSGAGIYSTTDGGDTLISLLTGQPSSNSTNIHILNGQVYAGGRDNTLIRKSTTSPITNGTDSEADNYISGATTATLTFNNLTEEFDQSDYFVVVTKGICEETSETVTLTVTCEPLVLTQPTDQTSPINGTATFSVPAVAGATYQWLGTDAELTQLNAGSNFGLIEDAFADGSNWYIARSNGFYVSNDGGENFVEKGEADGLDADEFVKVTGINGNVYVADKNAVFVSTNNGQSFQEIYSSVRIIVTLYVDANAIYVGTTTGLGVSTDGGANFSFKGTGDGLASSYIRSVSGSDGKVCVGANNQISVSSDNGTSFEKIDVHSADKGTVTDVLAVGSNIYVTTTQGLYISTDNGQNFTLKEETEGFELKNFTTISLTAEGFIMLGAANSGGLFSSLDEGNSFNKIQSATSGFSSIVKTFTSDGKDYVVNSGSIYQAETPIELIATQTENNAIGGVDTNTLTISNLSDELDQSSYFVVVTKGDCEETSETVTLTVGEVAPTITTLLPADNAENVSNNPDISITFDQAIAKGTGNIEVRRASDDQLLVDIAANSGLVSIEGNTATLALGDTNLDFETEYYITVPNTAFENASGVAFAGISDKTAWSFTTVEALELIGLSPENGATGVIENAFTMVFNHPVERSYPPTIRLLRTDDDTEVASLDHASSFVEFSEDKKTVEFYFVDENDVAIDLEASTGYYILLDNYFRAPLTGEFFSISQKTDWAFTTGETLVEPLLITSTAPSATEDAEIERNYLFIYFDEEIMAGEGTLTVYRTADDSEFGSVQANDLSIINATSGNRARALFPNDWEASTEYYVQLSAGLIKNTDGTKRIEAIDDKTTFTFTGESFAENIITRFSPATGSNTYVADSEEDLVLYTSENVGTVRDPFGAFRIYKASNNELVKTIESGGENNRDLRYGDDEPQIRFEFEEGELEPGTEYYILLDDGFIVTEDRERYHVGISDANTWRFTTLAVPSTPTLTTTSPATGAADVNITADIELTYSENIKAHVYGETMNVVDNVVLYDADNNVVETFPANTLSYSGATVTINPTNDLDYNATYYLLIDAEVFISNNRTTTAAVTDPTAISFTTGSQPNTAPVASAQDFAGNLEVNQQLTGSYTYTDADTDAESGTTFQWYMADDASGANSTAISGATVQNYSLTTSEAGKFVALAITPNDGTDAGTEVFTAYKGVVAAAVIPTLVSTVPTDEAMDISITPSLSLVLSEPVTLGDGRIIITDGSSSVSFAANSTNVSVSGSTVSIADVGPFPLSNGTYYTVTFEPSAFMDADGNNSAGLTSQTVWNFTTVEAQVAPVASAVNIKKSIVVDGTLEGTYSYSDGNNDPESGSTYQWYRADDAAGSNKAAISGANSQSYVATATDNNKFVSFEVTPNDGNLAGTAVESDFFGPVLVNDGVTNIPPAFTSDPLVTILDNVNYSYTITTEDLNSHAVGLTKASGPTWLSLSGGVLSGDPAGQVGDHMVVLTADDSNGGTVTQEFTVTVEASNTAPSVNGIEVSGMTTIDEQLTGAYNFVDAENDADNSSYKWYRADDNAGTNKAAIAGATATTYTLTSLDAGKFISFKVTPNDGKVDGSLAESTVVGAVAKKVPTLSLTAISKVYGDADFDLAASTNSTGAITYSFDNDQTSANLAGATVTLGNVGEITVEVSLTEDAEYQARQVQGSITVSKMAIEVTATSASKAVGESDPALAFTVTSGAIVGSDEVVTIGRDPGEEVGTYAMTFTDGAAAGNYDITKVDGLFTINPVAITVTANAATKTYGEADPAFTYSVTSGALNTGDALSGTITREAGEDAGTYALQSSLFSSDYDITFVGADFTISKADLTATADDQTRFIGEANPALTISYSGFVNGDTETNITAPTIATFADENSPLGTYDITLSGGVATNYNLSLVNGMLTVAQRPFITTWEITSSDVNRSRTFFTAVSGQTYLYDVDWGDNTVETNQATSAAHAYTEAGTYTIKITGQFPQIQMGFSRLESVEQWGDIVWESMESAFVGSSFSINATDAPDLSQMTSMKGMFDRANIGTADLIGWDVSTITDMSEMFKESDFNGDISNWDVSNVMNTSFMFAQTANFNSDITSWNTSGVQDMSYMFYFAEVFNQAIDSWNVGSVTDMSSMFADAAAFNQDLNSWDVSKVTTMEKMFDNAELFNGNITGWDVSGVSIMSNMFDDAKVFNQDLDGWNVSNVTRMNAMFNDAEAFNQDLNSWNTSKVTTFVAMFQNTDVFNGVISNWDVSNATRLERMFEDAHAFNQDISNWQPTNAENLTAMFRDARTFNQDISSWRFPNANSLSQMFYEAAVFNQDISSWETGSITDMSSMFEDAEAFNQDISGWDVSTVTSFGSMFRGTLAFNQDISKWDMSAATGISSMFKNAAVFNQDISDWTFASGDRVLTSMGSVFENAAAFDQDLSGWDLTNIRSLSSIFSNSGMSVGSYDATLIGWAAQDVQDEVEFGVEGLQFCAGNAARQSLIDDHNWTIENDSQSCTATVTIADVSGNEDNGNITVTLTSDAFVVDGFTVDVSTANGTATAGTDYTAVTSQTITFAGTVGETQNFTISPTTDTDVEGNETLTVSMSNLVTGANNSVTITDEAIVTIAGDDQPVVSFATVSASNPESTSSQDIEVTLDQAGLSAASVDYAVSGTATGGGTDYTLAAGTLNFAVGDVSETINLAIIDDASIETDETVVITLSNASGASIGTNTVFTYTIVNNDAQVTIEDVSQFEDGESFLVTATLEGNIAGGFTVDAITADGTATTADGDYTALIGTTLTFSGTDGETSTFNINPGVDTKLEANETFTVSMTNLIGTAATVIITDQATLTITNDDAAAVTIADVSGNEGDGPITVTATLDNAVQDGFTVNVSTVDGTATIANSDYTALTARTLTFAGIAGETQTFTISPIDDQAVESDETLMVSLSNPGSALGIDITDEATISITNDDQATVSLAGSTSGEGDGSVTITATLDNAVDGGFTVDLITAESGAIKGVDYTGLENVTLTFRGIAGETQSTTITLVDDNIVEFDESIFVLFDNLGGTSLDVTTGDVVEVVIEDNDEASVTIADLTQFEDGESFLVTATLDKAVSGGFRVDVSTIDGTAMTVDGDYTALTGTTLTFAGTAGETQIFEVSPGADGKLETNETFTVSMSNLAGTTLPVVITDDATMTITNDDAAAVTIADASGNEGDGAITVTATLDNAVQGGFTVDVSTVDGTATVADGDYTAIAGQTLIFAGTAGETQTFTITPINDIIIEGDETLSVSMSNLSTSLGVDITDGATVTIINDDFNNAPTDIALSATSIDENEAMDALIGSLSTTDADAGDTHAYSLVTGTGSADNDFFILDGNELKANNISFNFEDRDSYSIRLQSDDGKGGLFAKAFAINITNVNETPFALSLTNSTIDEADDTQEVGMFMSLDPDNGDSFSYTLVAGTGDDHNDQFSISGSTLNTAGAINFEDGDTRNIRVRVTDAGGLDFEMAFTITIEDVVAEPVRPFTQNASGADVKNVFSPNGDGVNETWVIEDLLDNPFNEVKIFAQGGKLIYSKVNYINDWAGTFRDDPVPDGTYYYEITIFARSGDTTPARVVKGFLTIIRNR